MFQITLNGEITLLEHYRLMQHVECPAHQSGHIFYLIITKEKNAFCLSDPKDKFYISDHSFVHSISSIDRSQAVRKTVEEQWKVLMRRKLKKN